MNRHSAKPIKVPEEVAKHIAETMAKQIDAELFKTFIDEANKWLKSVRLTYVHGETPEQAAKRSRLVEKQFSPLSRN